MEVVEQFAVGPRRVKRRIEVAAVGHGALGMSRGVLRDERLQHRVVQPLEEIHIFPEQLLEIE